jgi:DNA topoisomerase IA
MILIIHEKRTQAKSVCDAMNWNMSHDHYTGTFNGAPCVGVWAKGHLLEIQSPKESMPDLSWNNPNTLTPIVRDDTIVVAKDSKDTKSGHRNIDYLNRIKKYIVGADLVIGGTDSDREGEAIFWNIIRYFNYKGPIKRAWYAAGLDEMSIKEAMSNLKDPIETLGMAYAADARRCGDWAYMVLVVAYTYYARYNVFGKNLASGEGAKSVVSIGRVQTPILSVVVARDLEIEGFIPKDHFKIKSNFNVGGATLNGAKYSPSITFDMTQEYSESIIWEPSKKIVTDGEAAPLDAPLYVDKLAVANFKNRLVGAATSAYISSYKETRRLEQPKKPFTSNAAISAIVKKCKISTKAAQEVIEDLYAQGWTAYPRTSKPDLPYNLYLPKERNSLLSSMLRIPGLQNQAKEVMDIHNGVHPKHQQFLPSCYSKKDMEHYGIITTHQVMTEEKLNSLTPSANKKSNYTGEHLKQAYLLIAKQFIMALYPPAEYAVQSIELSVPVTDMHGLPVSVFKSGASKMLEPGWRAAFNDTDFDVADEDESNNAVPRMREGNLCPLLGVDISATKTKPPAKFNEVSLLSELENIGKYEKDPKYRKLLAKSQGIGTPATRPDTVLSLITHGFMEINKGIYTSTPKGRDLIKSVPSWLSSATLTAVWEDYLIKICETKNEANLQEMRNQFVDRQTKKITELIHHLIATCENLKGEKQVKSSGKKPTPTMIAVIKSIAGSKSIEIPKEALLDFSSASAFISEHRVEKQEGYIFSLSEAQKTLFNTVNNSLPSDKQINIDLIKSHKELSDFVEKHKRTVPPSGSQITLAEKLMSKMTPEEKAKVPKNVLLSRDACSKFISSKIKKK